MVFTSSNTNISFLGIILEKRGIYLVS